MNTKTIILLFVAIMCIQCELSSGASDKITGTGRRRVVSKSPSGKSKNSIADPANVKDKAITSDNDGTDPITTIIKGENGVITINGKAIENDEDFKKGLLLMEIFNGGIYINHNLILKKDTSSPHDDGKSTMNDYDIKEFEIRVKESDKIVYTDNRGAIMNTHW